jgi:hypothetical protein
MARTRKKDTIQFKDVYMSVAVEIALRGYSSMVYLEEQSKVLGQQVDITDRGVDNKQGTPCHGHDNNYTASLTYTSLDNYNMNR